MKLRLKVIYMGISDEIIESAQQEIDVLISKYVGKTVEEIKLEFFPEGTTNNKAQFTTLARTMLGQRNHQVNLLNDRFDCILKTVRVTGNEKPAESMSFIEVDFDDWCLQEEWKQTRIYQYFKTQFFLFFVFQQFPLGKRVADSEMTFKGATLYKVTDYDLNHGIKEVWQEVKSLVNENRLELVPYTQKNGKIVIKNNLPATKFNGIAHLRPGGKNGDDKVQLPNGQSIVRQRIWFNTEYVAEIIKDI